ncbi:MAG TPA: tRNA preQ1(34) S-adenosylmethionine ribosyltransferase-isomerase QueA [Burkholderiales bacterium]|nr:tRNA preQ1(34) S-adenosylmethionine ribosyltransferase-isomerase QueA [Burkholderiales bacterium]
MRTEEFEYELPQELIAQFPAVQRSASRLLYLDGATGSYSDHSFVDLPLLLRNSDLLVFNDTKVIKARLLGLKESGGKVEVLIERIVSPRRTLAMLRTSHAPRPGQRIQFGDRTYATMIERQEDFFLLEFGDDVAGVLERLGEVPLPPYIERHIEREDEARYQTVYARVPGAVAAPTAGLHFDEQMLGRLEEAGVRFAYVTLHVGAGTFQPVRVDNIDQHVMHGEHYEIPPETAQVVAETRADGGRITAVGTTSLRALESAAKSGKLISGSGETRLFIRPGYSFKVVDRLLTNFHLPRSTLLMLVCAFAGTDHVRRAYRHAVDSRYRFFSYGDAMLIDAAVSSRP